MKSLDKEVGARVVVYIVFVKTTSNYSIKSKYTKFISCCDLTEIQFCVASNFKWTLNLIRSFICVCFPFTARNSIKIYLNTNGHPRGKCSLSYTSKRKATFSNGNDNVICYQIQPDNDSYSISDPHVMSSKKLSVGLRRWV